MANAELPLRFKTQQLDDDTKKALSDVYPTVENFRHVGSEKWIVHKYYETIVTQLRDEGLNPSDVLVMGYPRSGTTMLQELTWLLKNDLDFDRAKQISIYRRTCLLDSFAPEFTLMKDISTNGRVIKTHFPFSILPENLLESKAKVLYIARSPKNVIVSFYHLQRMIKFFNFTGTFHEFYDLFENGLVPYGSFWKHLEEAWRRKDKSNICFLFYEDFISDINTFIEKVASCLGKQLTEAELSSLKKHMAFQNLKHMESFNATKPAIKKGYVIRTDPNSNLLRKGEVGGVETYFDNDLAKRANDWIAKNEEKLGIKFSEH